MTTPLVFGGVDIRPGSRQPVELPLPLLYTHTPVVMSTQVIRGRRDGPSIFVSAAVHRDEINGVEIIRRGGRAVSDRGRSGIGPVAAGRTTDQLIERRAVGFCSV